MTCASSPPGAGPRSQALLRRDGPRRHRVFLPGSSRPGAGLAPLLHGGWSPSPGSIVLDFREGKPKTNIAAASDERVSPAENLGEKISPSGIEGPAA